MNLNRNKTIGWLLIIGGILLFIPYTLLTINFEYPAILRQDTGTILTKFHEGGSSLIWTWFAFALVGLPLFPAYVLIGERQEKSDMLARTATIFGLIGLLVQMVGLLRWTFVVPILANEFTLGNDIIKEAAKIGFKVVHQYGGVILGEHIGQLFTLIWTIMITRSFDKVNLFSKWIIWLGYISSGIYFLAQAELIATVIPTFPVWDLAGFLGSTLWLLWLIIIGFKFLKIKDKLNEKTN